MLQQMQLHRQILFDLATHYLDPLNGDFERLSYLAGLRDPLSGAYLHDRLGVVYGEQAVSEALAKCHAELFERVLETPLARQEQDLLICLRSLRGGFELALRSFDDLIHSWIPQDAPEYLKELFCSNLSVLRELMTQRLAKAH